MKKLSLFFSAAIAVAASAHAQSSVTIYGVADVGIQIDKGSTAGGASTVSEVAGGHTGSRLGFRGREDMGGGLAAIFDLQMGINMDNGSIGQGGLAFGRTSFVGISSSSWGTLRLGRIDSPLYAYTWKYDPLGDSLGGAFTRLVPLTATHRRQDNTIDYASPKMSGFSSQASYSFGEVAGRAEAGRRMSAALGYDEGPISFSIAHQSTNNVPTGANAAVTTRLTGVGASYAFSNFTLSALYQVNKDNAAAALDTRDLVFGGSARWGNHGFMASFIKHSDEKVSGGDAHQVAAAYLYYLSKRTNLYAGASRISNGRNARFGLPAVAAGGAASGSSPKLVVAGVRHLF